MPEPAELLPARNRQPFDAIRSDTGNRRNGDELLLHRTGKSHALCDAGGFAAQIALEARLLKQCVDGLEVRCGASL
jgi:hypothetical protein